MALGDRRATSFREGDQELLIHTEKTGRGEGIQTWFNDIRFPCCSSGFKHTKSCHICIFPCSAMGRTVPGTGPRDGWVHETDLGGGRNFLCTKVVRCESRRALHLPGRLAPLLFPCNEQGLNSHPCVPLSLLGGCQPRLISLEPVCKANGQGRACHQALVSVPLPSPHARGSGRAGHTSPSVAWPQIPFPARKGSVLCLRQQEFRKHLCHNETPELAAA